MAMGEGLVSETKFQCLANCEPRSAADLDEKVSGRLIVVDILSLLFSPSLH
jgi:hypothetical protein